MALANITNNILTDTGVNVSSLTPTSTTISTTAPLQGGGDLSANRTLSITQSGTSANGFLSSTDWNTFNNKQAAGNYMTSLTGEATGTGPGATAVTLNNASVTAKVLTGVNITGGTVVATDSILTAFGKLQNQINGLIGSSVYQGTWNAATNTPALASGVGTRGYYYIVAVAGTTNLDGITDWFVGDWAIFDGTAWQQVDNTDAVVSVNGQTGAVSLTTDNVPEGATNQYFLNSRARAALSFTAGSGAYNSTTGVITIPTNTSQLTNGANFITLASLSVTAPIQYNNTTGAISITQSGTASNGYLSSTDWNTFNNKQSALTNPVTGTGTTNYLAKFTGTSTIGDSNILIQGGGFYLVGSEIFTNANGGIFFNGNGSYATGIFGYSTSNNIRVIAPNQIDFHTASTQRMLIDASGNLGLGVTPSAWGTGSSARALQLNAGSLFSFSTTQLHLEQNSYFSGSGFVYTNNGLASAYRQVDGVHAWYIAPVGMTGSTISFTQAMTLDASGRLFVGLTSGYSNGVTIKGTSDDYALTIAQSNASNAGWGQWADTSGNYKLSRYGGGSYSSPALTIALTGAATFSSSVTAGSQISILGSDGGGKQLFFTGGTTKYNFMIAAQQNVNNALEITPSSAAGGSTFSTPAVVVTSGGRVGIGTSSPSYKFDVVENTTDWAARIYNTNAGGYGMYIQTNNSSNSYRAFEIYNTAAEVFVITNAGNLGINTTDPKFLTHISTGNTTSITQPTAGSYGLYIQQNTSGNVGGLYIQDGASNSGNAIFVGDNNGVARFIVNGDGDVGIGTSSPATKLHIVGNVAMTGTNPGIFMNGSAVDQTSLISNANGPNTILKFRAGSFIWVNSDDTERMRITSSGNLSIGNTNDTYKLDVSGTGRFNTNGNALRLNSTSNDVWATFIPQTGHVWRMQARTTSQFSVYNENLGIFPFTIESTGAATFSNYVEASYFFANSGGSLFLQNASDAITIRQNSTSNNLTIKFNRSGINLWGIQTVPNGANEDFRIYNYQNSTSPFIINSAGGATFSSSVTANGTLTIGQTGVTNGIINSNDGMYFNIDADASGSTPEFMFGKGRSTAGGGGTTLFTIANSGAATFSSSVTSTAPANALLYQFNGRSSDNLGQILFYANNGSSLYSFMTSASSEFILGTVTSIPLGFYTNNTEKMRITSGGNVGIGTTNPEFYGKFAIRGGITAGGLSGVSFSASDAVNATFYLNHSLFSGVGSCNLFSDSILTLGSNLVERMRITLGGNVGIGTTSPVYKLEVSTSTADNHIAAIGTAPSINVSSANSGPANWGTVAMATTAGHFIVGASAGDFILLNRGSTAGNILFGFGSSEKMRITSGGNVGIGNTGSSNTRLSINGADQTSSNYALAVSGSSSLYIYVRNDGYLYSASAWSGSDRRLKENITDLDNGLNKILGIKARKFDFINGFKNQYGFIAQELQQIIPNAVSTYDEKNGMLAIKMDFIVPHLVKAIQELKAELDILKNK